MSVFSTKTIVLGITGGISAYKSVELARLLVKAGANVKVVMTEAGEKFVTPLTFRTITGNQVAASLWSDPLSPFPHISLSEEADLIVVAPATANMIAKCAGGIADDLLSTTLLAARSTIVLAPAMNSRMYLNKVTSDNLSMLRERGVVVIEPDEGSLACGDEGIGRMAEPEAIVECLEREIAIASDLAGRKVVVTAGPTREFMDPVRFMSNPSTGRMGYAVAERAARRGAEVLLITGPTHMYPPVGIETVSVVSAEEMAEAVLDNVGGADVLVMAAAVADYRPASVSETKVKKRNGIPELELVPTRDILTEVKDLECGCVLIGFAAETDDVLDNAREKLQKKGLDLVVANKVAEPDSGFSSETNTAAIISPDSGDVRLERFSKPELADLVLDRAKALLS